MRYVRVEVDQITKSLWRAYIPHSDLFISGTTRGDVQEKALRTLEVTEGLKGFEVIWL